MQRDLKVADNQVGFLSAAHVNTKAMWRLQKKRACQIFLNLIHPETVLMG